MPAEFPGRQVDGLGPTDFKSQWEAFAFERRLDLCPTKWHVFTRDELRRVALEFFSWGCRHQAHTQRRLEQLLPGQPGRQVGGMGPAAREANE